MRDSSVTIYPLVDRIQRLVPTSGGGDDRIGIGQPSEGFWVDVVLGEVSIDRGLEVDNAEEGSAFQPPLGQRFEEDLDGVEP